MSTCFSCEDIAKILGRRLSNIFGYSPTKLWDGAEVAIIVDFLRAVFSASRVQHVSDMHLKFAHVFLTP